MVEESDSLLKKQKKYFLLLGVTVYEGQAIEQKLKKLSKFIPYQPDNIFAGISKEDFLAKEKVLEKRTLGYILNNLKERGTCLNDQNAEFIINKFVSERNTVIHHLLKLPNFNFNTEEGIDVGIKFLEQYRETIKLINDIFDPILLASYIMLYENVQIIDDVQKYRKNLDNLYSLYHETLTRAGGSLKIEVHNNLDEIFDYLVKNHYARNDSSAFNSQEKKQQLWQNTKIIRVLSNIGKNIANQDGWISLSVCQQRLKTEYPEIKPENYGFNSILEIIKTSDLFDIKKYKCKKHNKYKVYFRFY